MAAHPTDSFYAGPDDLTFRRKKIPRTDKQRYEDSLTPAQRPMDLAERRCLRKKP